jgi:hypothetical protein
VAALLGVVSPAPLESPPSDTTAAAARAIVRQATAAVAGDSADPRRTPWQATLAHDSSDRAATLGLAALARLTYDYPSAERLYRMRTTGDEPDGYGVYARIGLATGFNEYGRMQEIDGLLSRARSDARALRDRTAEGEALLLLGDRLPVKSPPPCQQSPLGKIATAFRYGAREIAVQDPRVSDDHFPFIAK